MMVRKDEKQYQLKQYSAAVHQRNILRRKLIQARSPRIGIFFFANGELFADTIPIRYGYYVKGCQVFIVVRDVVSVTVKHAQIEASIVRAMKKTKKASKKLEGLLRGRVVYDRKKRRYIVIADRAVVDNERRKVEIIAEFCLPDERTLFKQNGDLNAKR